MKYPQNQEQSRAAIEEYEEFIAEQGKYGLRINLNNEQDGETLVSQVDACYFRRNVLEDQIVLTDMTFSEEDEDENTELHINRISLSVSRLEMILNIVKAYKIQNR